MFGSRSIMSTRGQEAQGYTGPASFYLRKHKAIFNYQVPLGLNHCDK